MFRLPPPWIHPTTTNQGGLRFPLLDVPPGAVLSQLPGIAGLLRHAAAARGAASKPQPPSPFTAHGTSRRPSDHFLNCNDRQVLRSNRVTGHPRRGSACIDIGNSSGVRNDYIHPLLLNTEAANLPRTGGPGGGG